VNLRTYPVTGATDGIGKATALARQGASVIIRTFPEALCDRNPDSASSADSSA
jgi:NAD(P)-dependent dehydrogenase (short-subunit alcohol dehydrogenase family)